jgi:hypothetical protein
LNQALPELTPPALKACKEKLKMLFAFEKALMALAHIKKYPCHPGASV